MVRLGLSFEAFIETLKSKLMRTLSSEATGQLSYLCVPRMDWVTGICVSADPKVAGAALDVHAVVTCGW